MRTGYPADRGASYSCGRPKKAAEQQTETPEQLRTAAEQGKAAAQSNLGLMYAKGQGVPQDYAEAVRWFRKAAGHSGPVLS
jgi:hypothetical protein